MRRLLLLLAAALMALLVTAGPPLAAPGNGQGVAQGMGGGNITHLDNGQHLQKGGELEACGDKDILLEVEEYEMAVLHNETRVEQGLSPLCVDKGLTEAARYHSEDMKYYNYFDHPSYDGTPFNERIERFGGSCPCSENLVWGEGEYATAQSGFERLMASPDHEKNIVHPDLESMGVGVAKSDDVATYTIDYSMKE